MTEQWESDGPFGDFGPINEDDWVVAAYYEIPLEEARIDTKPVLSFNTCRIILDRYGSEPPPFRPLEDRMKAINKRVW